MCVVFVSGERVHVCVPYIYMCVCACVPLCGVVVICVV